ncbi:MULTISPECIES: bifunctional 2-polyprenyl-6-hydroxyphenol methylase/3-demethylubiquinol 3-O-methyltransferase UbiG [unclassified Bradyrhizobium]|uniref:class I SAM-dependent methyltransferase n=1 Tax=unclassified Bradyrhizobium TaxID=2631580 RepID=UPI00055B3B42|nr:MULTISPECIES: class I SAM-dependent methyltransferase [unclassified Bradyrhizobium]MCK1295193.1 class I SAM-dependent methyltransferase [Bradyrhizobium sp. 30]
MDYYHWIRRDIEPLLPKQSTSILEVGAGAGATLRWLKEFYPKAETTAVEINPALLDELMLNADLAIIGPVDQIFAQLKSYDLILLLDVLEHLPDPRATLQNLAKVLNPGGRVIVSVPNIAHFSVSIPLLLRRRFDYREAGILDRTHLKFFVEDTAIRLLNDAHLNVTDALICGMERRGKIFNSLSFGLLQHYLARQYLMLGQLSDRDFVQQKIQWKVAD